MFAQIVDIPNVVSKYIRFYFSRMITKNSKVLLTINLEGRLGATVSNVSSKDIMSKVITSPVEIREVVNKKFTGNYITPKNHYKAPSTTKLRTAVFCQKHTTISEDAVNYMISEGSGFYPYDKYWKKLSLEDRLKAHLGALSNGREFTFEVLN